MDVAYDHIQEEALEPGTQLSSSNNGQSNANGAGLNAEFQEAFKAVSASPWGARLGGFFGQLKSQGESLYADAQKEYAAASSTATKGLSDLASRARTISITQVPSDEQGATSFSDPTFALPASPARRPQPGATSEEDADGPSAAKGKEPETASVDQRPESLPADIVKEAGAIVTRFRSEAASRLVAVRKAEDAADEALLRFGSNLRNFLRDAVSVAAPDDTEAGNARGTTSEVLFETNEDGRRVFHSSRLEARLYAVHCRTESFTMEPEGEEWESWRREFDAEKQTERIAGDLEKYEELRRAMEKVVPAQVSYKDFWMRYYYLRMAIDEEEKRRKEVLKGAIADDDEEVGWGDDDEDDGDATATTPVVGAGKVADVQHEAASQSTTTLTPANAGAGDPASPGEKTPRKSHDEDKKSSSADSDASYDMIVSGATSQAPGSPKASAGKKDDSDDEDWE